MTTERHIFAECRTCEWTSTAPNARATGASHARRNRHDVIVNETVHHRYAGPPPGQTSLEDEPADRVTVTIRDDGAAEFRVPTA